MVFCSKSPRKLLQAASARGLPSDVEGGDQVSQASMQSGCCHQPRQIRLSDTSPVMSALATYNKKKRIGREGKESTSSIREGPVQTPGVNNPGSQMFRTSQLESSPGRLHFEEEAGLCQDTAVGSED